MLTVCFGFVLLLVVVALESLELVLVVGAVDGHCVGAGKLTESACVGVHVSEMRSRLVLEALICIDLEGVRVVHGDGLAFRGWELCVQHLSHLLGASLLA